MARPKGSKGHKTIARTVASERYEIWENGKKRKVTNLEMVLLMLRNEMIAGNRQCLKFLDELSRRHTPAEPEGPVGYLFAPPIESEEEWRERVERQQAQYRAVGGYDDDPFDNDPSPN